MRVNPSLKKRALHRIKILQGQLEGLGKAIEEEVYCPNLLSQSLAIQRSLKSLDAFLLENHLRSHVTRQLAQKNMEDQTIRELITVYTLSHK